MNLNILNQIISVYGFAYSLPTYGSMLLLLLIHMRLVVTYPEKANTCIICEALIHYENGWLFCTRFIKSVCYRKIKLRETEPLSNNSDISISRYIILNVCSMFVLYAVCR